MCRLMLKITIKKQRTQFKILHFKETVLQDTIGKKTLFRKPIN